MPETFETLRSQWPDKATAWDLGKRPVPQRCSDARVLDPDTAIVAVCEPGEFRRLAREWHDRGTAEELAEAVHQLELERAAQPPVIEVTVTTPPDGIGRADLDHLVRETVAGITGPLPSSADPGLRKARRMLVATRRAAQPRPASPAALPVPDDTPTQVLPVYREDPPTVVEVYVP